MSARIAVAAVVLSSSVASWAASGDQTGRVGAFLIAWGAAFLAYLLALTAAPGLSSRQLRAALALAVVWRLALVAAPPLLSDDVYRSVWEGRIQLHGGNPYAWSDRPEAEQWAGLRDETWRRVNHKDYAAIYPPLWQLAVRLVVAIHDSPLAMKLFAVLCELAALGMLAALLRGRGLPPGRLLVLAWSPLALVEIAGSGHSDALGLTAVAAALLALERGRRSLAAAAVAAGIGAKLLPGLIAVAWWRRLRPLPLALALLGAALLALPYAGAGEHLWHSLDKYSRFWRFNETLFGPLADSGLGHDAAVRAGALASLALAAVLGARRVEPAGAGLALVAAWLLLSPNVLPWYALWLLPFLVLRPEPAALLFTGTVALAYLVYPAWQSGERWQVGWEVRALEYLPCLAVAAWTARARRGDAPGTERR